jgi:hypothetical protein
LKESGVDTVLSFILLIFEKYDLSEKTKMGGKWGGGVCFYNK